MNADTPEVERLICQIRNNLAYYVSEEHVSFGPVDSDVQAECLSLVKWLESRIDNYPSDSSIYRHTVETVRERLSPSNETAG